MTLPNFLIVGAAKSGTTSLALNLAEHPEVFVATGEPHFFSVDEHWWRGTAWYETHFDRARPDERAVGEKTPSYLCSDDAATRIVETLSTSCRCIAILREPCDRVWSHVNHRRREGKEAREASDAVTANLAGADDSFDYVGQSLYAPHLARLGEALDDGCLHVEFYEDLARDPEGVYRRIFAFLGVAPFTPRTISTAFNQSSRFRHPRAYGALLRARAGRWLPAPIGRRVWEWLIEPAEYDPIPVDLRSRLQEAFRPHNPALAALVGRPLPADWTS